MTNQLYQLVVRKGPRPGQVFPLELDLLTVGRDPLSDIVIEDPEVSRHHASFTQSDEGFLLLDKGSTNGSFVDGERLGGEAVQLNPGQVIMFGSTVTLVYQATSVVDPLATMVAPAAAIEPEVPEPEEAPEEPLEVPEPDPLPSFEVEEPIAEEADPLPSFDEVDPVAEDPYAAIEPTPELEEEEAVAEELVLSEPEVDDLPEEEVEAIAFDVPESQPFLEEDDDAMATMVEDSPVIPVEEPVEPEPIPSFDDPEPEVAAPAFPTYEEPVPEVELPSEPPPLAPLPTYEEPEPEPVIDSPGFDYDQQEVAAPFDSAAPIADFDAKPVGSTPIQTSGEIVEDKAPGNRNRNIIIGVAAIFLLCCLCSIISSAVYFLAFAG